MRIAKKIIRFVIKLLLVVMLIAFILIQLLSSTILNEDYFLSTLEKTDYYKEIYDMSYSSFENYIDQSGLDEEVMNDIVSITKVRADTETIVSNIYRGKQQIISTQEIRDNLQKNIFNFLENRRLSNSEEEAIDAFITTICDEYKLVISSYSSVEDILYNFLSKIIKAFDFATPVFAIGSAVLLVVLLALNLKRKYRFFSDLGVVLLSSGCIFIVSYLFVHFNITVKHIILINEAVSKVLITIIQDILDSMVIYGIVFAVLGFALILIPNLIHNKLRAKKQF